MSENVIFTVFRLLLFTRGV